MGNVLLFSKRVRLPAEGAFAVCGLPLSRFYLWQYSFPSQGSSAHFSPTESLWVDQGASAVAQGRFLGSLCRDLWNLQVPTALLPHQAQSVASWNPYRRVAQDSHSDVVRIICFSHDPTLDSDPSALRLPHNRHHYWLQGWLEYNGWGVNSPARNCHVYLSNRPMPWMDVRWEE